jgi:hypothetical protein
VVDTLSTGKRIFIPVPTELADELRVATCSREFYVRFGSLNSDFDLPQTRWPPSG